MKTRRIFPIITAAIMALTACATSRNTNQIVRDETQTCCLSKSNGLAKISVWATGDNDIAILENASRKAVYEVIFFGVTAKNAKYNVEALITQNQSSNSTYFDKFFQRDGDFLKHVSSMQIQKGKSRKTLGDNIVSQCVNVEVNVQSLNERLLQDGIIHN